MLPLAWQRDKTTGLIKDPRTQLQLNPNKLLNQNRRLPGGGGKAALLWLVFLRKAGEVQMDKQMLQQGHATGESV